MEIPRWLLPPLVSLLAHFAALEYPPQHAKVSYPLREIMLRVLSATIAGADGFVETVPRQAEGPQSLASRLRALASRLRGLSHLPQD